MCVCSLWRHVDCLPDQSVYSITYCLTPSKDRSSVFIIEVSLYSLYFHIPGTGILMTFGSGVNGCLGHGDCDDVTEVVHGRSDESHVMCRRSHDSHMMCRELTQQQKEMHKVQGIICSLCFFFLA